MQGGWKRRSTRSVGMFLFVGQTKLKRNEVDGVTHFGFSFPLSTLATGRQHDDVLPDRAPLHDFYL